MAGGTYTALSGLRARIEQLDRLAADIANVGTAGYKSERTTTVAAHRPDFSQALETAIDVAAGPGRVDFRSGLITPTGRDLDFAIEGTGFFEVQTPAGIRYTRNGQFELRSDGTLVTRDGMPVLGVERKGQAQADRTLRLPKGPVTVEPDGTVRADGVAAGRISVVTFNDPTTLVREEAGRFRSGTATTPVAAEQSTVRGGAIEQSNVSLVERIAHMTEVSRSFQALQRGLSVMLNDIEGRAISEFGRR